MFKTVHTHFSHTQGKLYKLNIHLLKPDTKQCGNKQLAAASYQLGLGWHTITSRRKPVAGREGTSEAAFNPVNYAHSSNGFLFFFSVRD